MTTTSPPAAGPLGTWEAAATDMQRAAKAIREDHVPGSPRYATWAAVAHWLDSAAVRYLTCFAGSGIEADDWHLATEVARSYLREQEPG